jgi:Flp pilus assembly pilin Flp
MIAAGIAVAIVAAVQALGTNVTSLFTSVQSAFP